MEKIKELLESIKGNPYAQCKDEIHKISQERNVDVGVACSMLRHDKGWEYPEGDKDITEFTRFVQELSQASTDGYYYVKEYFEGKLD